MKSVFFITLFIGLQAHALDISAVFGGGADFTENTMLGKPLSDFKKKYPDAEKDVCHESHIQQCASKGIKCSCTLARLAQMRNRSESILVVSANDKIVEVIHGRSNGPELAEIAMPMVKEFSGDTKPNLVLEDGEDRGLKLLRLRWQFKNSAAVAFAWCPVEKFGGKVQMKTKLRDCRLKRAVSSSKTDFSDMTGTKVDYEY